MAIAECDTDDWLASRREQINLDAPRSFSGLHSQTIPQLLQAKGLDRDSLTEQCVRVLLSYMWRVRVRHADIDYTQVSALHLLLRLSTMPGNELPCGSASWSN